MYVPLYVPSLLRATFVFVSIAHTLLKTKKNKPFKAPFQFEAFKPACVIFQHTHTHRYSHSLCWDQTVWPLLLSQRSLMDFLHWPLHYEGHVNNATQIAQNGRKHINSYIYLYSDTWEYEDQKLLCITVIINELRRNISLREEVEIFQEQYCWRFNTALTDKCGLMCTSLIHFNFCISKIIVCLVTIQTWSWTSTNCFLSTFQTKILLCWHYI